mgnify:CR=1 FL=1
MEEIELYLDEAKELMQKAIDHTASELVKIRAGKAMPNLLDGVFVMYYGSPTPLSQVSSVTTPDARTLAIKPFERNLISEIEKVTKKKAIINYLPMQPGDVEQTWADTQDLENNFGYSK